MVGFLVEGLVIYAWLSLKGVDETARYSFIRIRKELNLKQIPRFLATANILAFDDCSKNLVSKISFLLIVESECWRTCDILPDIELLINYLQRIIIRSFPCRIKSYSYKTWKKGGQICGKRKKVRILIAIHYNTMINKNLMLIAQSVIRILSIRFEWESITIR